MADKSNALRRVSGGPLDMRSRRRWLAAAIAVGAWLAYFVISGSAFDATFLLVALMALAVIVIVGLRSFGIGPDHPLIQPLATRPWRDGRDVFRLALRQLRSVLIITPKGSLLAPNAIEVCMNPADLESLADYMDEDLANIFALEAYEAEIARSSARIRYNGPVDVKVIPDSAVPVGRFQLRQAKQAAPSVPAGGRGLRARDGLTLLDEEEPEWGLAGGYAGPASTAHSLLRLITGGSVAETRISGARAGRARATELTLPDDATISRVHAKFTWEDGDWWITGLGRNGVLLNGSQVATRQRIHDGDSIRWGRQPDAIVSQVEISY